MSKRDIEIEMLPKLSDRAANIRSTHIMEDSPMRMEFHDQTQEPPTPRILSESKSNKQNLNIFMDVLTAFALSRTIFVVLAQGAWMDIGTVANYCAIFFPIQITAYQLHYAYVPFSWRAFRIAFGVLKLLLLFGLAWTVPSTLASSNDTLSNFTAFLCLSRAYFALISIIDAYNFQTILNPSFINACLTFAPLITWILCYFTGNLLQFYSIFVIGVFIDILAVMFSDGITSQRLGLAVKYERPVFGLVAKTESITWAVQTHFGCCLWYLFETRRFVEYPDSVTAVQFSTSNYILGSVAALTLFNLFYLYNYGLKFWMMDSDRHLQNSSATIFVYTTVLRWMHFILTGSFGLLSACLSLLVFELYHSPDKLDNQFPLNLNTFPEALQLNRNLKIDYLKQAAAFGGITVNARSSFYLPVLVGVFGFYLICQSITEIAACKRIQVDVKKKTFSTFIPGFVILGLAFLPESVWQDSSSNLVVLWSLFGISTFLLVVSQFFVMVI